MFAVVKFLRRRITLCHLRRQHDFVLCHRLPGIGHGCPESVCLRLTRFRAVIYLHVNGIRRKLRARDLEGDALRAHIAIYPRKGHGRRTRRAVRARVVYGVIPSPDQTFPASLSVLPGFHKEHIICILLRCAAYRTCCRHLIVFLCRGIVISGRQHHVLPRVGKRLLVFAKGNGGVLHQLLLFGHIYFPSDCPRIVAFPRDRQGESAAVTLGDRRQRILLSCIQRSLRLPVGHGISCPIKGFLCAKRHGKVRPRFHRFLILYGTERLLLFLPVRHELIRVFQGKSRRKGRIALLSLPNPVRRDLRRQNQKVSVNRLCIVPFACNNHVWAFLTEMSAHIRDLFVCLTLVYDAGSAP